LVTIENEYDLVNEIIRLSKLLRRKIQYLIDISYLEIEDIKQELWIETFDKENWPMNKLMNLCGTRINKLLKEFKPEHELKRDIDLDLIVDESTETIDSDLPEDDLSVFDPDDLDSILNYENLRVAASEKGLNYNSLQKRVYRIKEKLRKEKLNEKETKV